MTAYILRHGASQDSWHVERARVRRRRRLLARLRRLAIAGSIAFCAWLLLSARAGAQEAYTASDTLAAIDQYSAEQGVSAALLTRVVSCETGGTFDPYSVGRQGELGAVQLHPRGELPRFLAWGYTDAFSPWQSVRFLAQRVAMGGAGAWSCR